MTEKKSTNKESMMASPGDTASKHLGYIFKKARNKRSLSQSTLSHAANINSSYYCSIEKGTANLTVKKFLSICDTLEERPCDIMRRLQNLQEGKEEYSDDE